MNHPEFKQHHPFGFWLREVITAGLFNPYFIMTHRERLNSLSTTRQIEMSGIYAYWVGAVVVTALRFIPEDAPDPVKMLGLLALPALAVLFYGWFTTMARSCQILTEEYARRGFTRKVYRGNSILGACYVQYHINRLYFDPRYQVEANVGGEKVMAA